MDHALGGHGAHARRIASDFSFPRKDWRQCATALLQPEVQFSVPPNERAPKSSESLVSGFVVLSKYHRQVPPLDYINVDSWDTILLTSQNTSTQSSRIMQLPTEILQQVFLSFIASSSNAILTCNNSYVRPPAMVLSHICSRWRQIAANYPPLWAIISHADFCSHHWIQVVLQRSGSCNLKVNFYAAQYANKELDMLVFVQRTGKVKELSLVTDYETFQKLQSSYREWSSNLEMLHISIGDGGRRDVLADDGVPFEDDIAHVNAQHLPNLPFFGKPHKLNHEETPNLRHLSLINCFVSLPLDNLTLYPNLERLEISHIPIECHHSVQSWSFIVRTLPRLKYLEIDGAMVWDSAFDNNFNQDLRLARLPPLSQLTDLRINRCTPACAMFLYNFSTQPRSLQFTCTDLRYDEEFRLFSAAMQMWMMSWDRTVPNRYLFLSIQPDGIIVHNRSTRHVHGDTTPFLQLVLYWKAVHIGQRLPNMLSVLLSVVFTPQPHPYFASYPSTSTLTLGCEELELSIGLFDYDDRKLQNVFRQALHRFGDVKKLTCIGGAGAVLASLASQGRPATENDLLPLLDCVCFDHVNFSGGIGGQLTDYFRALVNRRHSLLRVELDECRHVDRGVVTRLEQAGIRVTVGKGTVLVDNDDGLKRVGATRKPWTRDQVQLLMKKWADESRTISR